ncbi:MAG: leucine-rich repeat protein [Clostridiales bacterium]|nr:leucine-rich repeat protein [Clostridiales bacterium]
MKNAKKCLSVFLTITVLLTGTVPFQRVQAASAYTLASTSVNTVQPDAIAEQGVPEAEHKEELSHERTTLTNYYSADFTYTLSDNNATITGYSGIEAAVTIPDKIDGYPVVGIGTNAFRNMGGVKSVILPDSVTTIGSNAFQNCSNLSSINYPAGLQSVGGVYGMFDGCTSLTSMTVPEGVTELPSYVFCRSSLQSVDLPSTLKTIGGSAFASCTGLTSMSLPGSVTTIGSNAFQNCSNLSSINYPAGLQSVGSSGMFNGCTSLTSMTVPEGVTELPNYVFYRSSLQAVALPSTLKTIGSSAFANCTGLISVKLPDSVTTIGSNAFQNCSNLSSINYPTRLESVGSVYGMFDGCTSLTSMTVPEGVTELPSDVFNRSSLQSVDLPSTLKTIGSSAFARCTGLTSMSLPDSVTAIGSNAFQNCSNLSSINYPTGLESVGGVYGIYGMFNGCTSLTSMTVPEGVTGLPSNVFNRSSLQSVDLPSTLKTIGSSAFASCTGLTSMSLPDGVTTIGSNAFQNCSNLSSINYPAGLQSVGTSGMFNGCTSLTSIIIPEGVTALPNYVFYRSLLREISLPDTIKTIGNYAFRYCTGITELHLPGGLATIGNRAFSDCSNLDIILIPASVTKFGSNVFGDKGLGLTIVGTAGSEAERYAASNTHRFVEANNFITIEMGDMTSVAKIDVSGSARKDSVVTIYDGAVKIGEFTAKANNRYGGSVTLTDGYGMHIVKAETMEEGGRKISAIKTIKYDDMIPELEEFILYHAKQRHDLLDETENRQILTFQSDGPITFEIKMSNIEDVGQLFVYSEKNGEIERLQAYFDAAKGLWVASGFFNRTNAWVPGAFSVRYQPDYDFNSKNETIDLKNQPDWKKIESSLPTEWKEAEITVEEDTPTRTVVNAVLADEQQTSLRAEFETVSKPTNQTIEQLLDAGYVAVRDVSGTTYYVDVQYTVDKIVMTMFEGSKAVVNELDDMVTIISIYGDVLSDIYGNDFFFESIGMYAGDFSLLLGATSALFTATDVMLDTASAYYQIDVDYRKGLISKEEADLRKARIETLEACYFFAQLLVPLAAKLIVAGIGLAGFPVISVLAVAGVSYLLGEGVSLTRDVIKSWILGKPITLRIKMDPSGYVYEAVRSNRLKGAKMTAYHKDGPDGVPILWNAEEWDELNPIYTDGDGRYVWDVPEGLWQVKGELDGYETVYSEWLPVPPAQTDVNLAMVSKAVPEIFRFNIYETYAEVEFTNYVQPETVHNLALKSPGGIDVSYALFYEDAEFSKLYQLVYNNHTVPSNATYSLTTNNSILSYSGVPVKAEACTADSEIKPFLTIPDRITVDYGKTADVEVIVENYDSSKPLALEVESEFSFIAEVASIGAIGADGKATVRIVGNLPGDVDILFAIPEKGIREMLPVGVNMLLASPEVPITPAVNLSTVSKSTVNGDVEYVLSLASAKNVLSVELEFEVDSSLLGSKGVETFCGFKLVDGIKWINTGGTIWKGAATFDHSSGGSHGFSSGAAEDIASFIFTAKNTGAATMKLTKLEVSGYDDALEQVVEYDAVIETGEATTVIESAYSIYDLNRDGKIDALDLGILLLYCGFKNSDPEWSVLVKVNDSVGNAVTASMCDVNGDGMIDILDLVDLFINYTK